MQGGARVLQSYGFHLFQCVCCCCCCQLLLYGGSAWFFNIFSLLLLLSVDVFLVCAGGYTQVTGVMAMMMTSRVLLVCALCVLWCGAVFGHAMDDYCSEGGGNGLRHTSNGGDDGVSLKADCGLLATRMALIKAVEAADEQEMGVPGPSQDTGEPLQNDTEGSAAPGPGRDVAGPAEAAIPPKPGGSDSGGQEEKPEGLDANGGKEADHKEDRNDSTATGPQHQSVDQSSSFSSSSGSPGTQSGEEHNLENTSKSDESSDDSPEDDESDPLSQSDSREEKAE
ncbi:mucin-associated surface protein (MASP) [Trypanosoma cruzi]|nr:mucin-associated surface protein (MASP) [Trypanosoma cruzi]